MPITVRQRGKVWHARGTVRVGRETIRVPEFSTGSDSRGGALAIAQAEEARIRADTLDGRGGRLRRTVIGDAILSYLGRPKSICVGDRMILVAFADAFGGVPISDAATAWSAWAAKEASGFAPATVARRQGILRAALRHGCAALDLGEPPRLPSVAQDRQERVACLTDSERELLLSCYNPRASDVALTLAYQGLRTQEALRLDWRNVSLTRGTLHVTRTKTGRARTVPMHPHVRTMLEQIATRADTGPVFLSSRGAPYADTRGHQGDQTWHGGNPIAQAHDHACQLAGVRGFRVHDWRHDWATRLVSGGVDLVTLMRLGGWRTMSMVERYVSIETGRLADAIRLA